MLRYGNHCIKGTEGEKFIKPIEDLIPKSEILNSSTLAFPLDGFVDVIKKITGIDISNCSNEELQKIKFLIVGFHTEKRVFSISNFLRNYLGFQNVAVTPHLVGSANKEAHFNSLRYHFPDSLIKVIPGLSETSTFIGIDPEAIETFSCNACEIKPEETKNALNAEQKLIIEILCMHWTRAELRPLKGGFSGSLLLLANGWKGNSRTEPMVIKIDKHATIRMELDGYERAKDLLGMHVPTFSPPVSYGEYTGISMDLASMEGQPETVQEYFETAIDDKSLDSFLSIFDRTLSLMVEKVYQNTLSVKQFEPYRHYLLHINQQDVWLAENIKHILNQKIGNIEIETDFIKNIFTLVRKNDDGLNGEMCLAHGDLNLANVICDSRENIWTIDWTYAGLHPLEMDFTKLENDIKFVISKNFNPDDFGKLQKLEDYLLSVPLLEPLEKLHETLKFVVWDIRFKKIYLAIKTIREYYFSAKKDKTWLTYRIALLRYGVHTLSFDESRNLGECGPVQLWYALYSIEQLLFQLVGDDFHLKIRGERPSTYPHRFRISIDQAIWKIPCSEYSPPYHVEQSVLENEREKVKDGWADPEENWEIEKLDEYDNLFSIDSDGKPLNPRGRTGIAGRGALGRWGPNPIILLVITRINSASNQFEILLEVAHDNSFKIPENNVNYNESFDNAVTRIGNDVGLDISIDKSSVLNIGYLYDMKQTDNAWVVAKSYLTHYKDDSISDEIKMNKSLLKWKALSSDIINKLSSSRASLIREAVNKLARNNKIKQDIADTILQHTG
ncbi:MAG: hypothetical protein ACTSUV_02185 [Candidatus Ranarchaeia archaeon]